MHQQLEIFFTKSFFNIHKLDAIDYMNLSLFEGFNTKTVTFLLRSYFIIEETCDIFKLTVGLKIQLTLCCISDFDYLKKKGTKYQFLQLYLIAS